MIENANIKLAEDIRKHETSKDKFGDWLPFILKIILVRNGKLDVTACLVLSKICYWFTLKKNGKKRFFGDELRLSISDLSKQTLLSRAQTRHALEILENKYKYIRRTNVGSVTYLNLNTEILRNAIELHEVNFAQENDLMCEKQHVHIHKERTKKNVLRNVESNYDTQCELIRTRIENVETTILHKNNELEDYELDFSEFWNVCNTVSNIFDTKIKHGLSKRDLLHTYVYDLASLKSQPAYAKLYYLANEYTDLWHQILRSGTVSVEFSELVRAFLDECTAVPDVYSHFVDTLEHPYNTLFMNLLDFDITAARELYADKKERINKEKLKLANTLEVYVSELKQLQGG
tara:strand:+ start:549 stop:1589 length:1041 start_codon:yes stop_codon:yes gene_type:complete